MSILIDQNVNVAKTARSAVAATGLFLLGASLAHANENDTLFQAIENFCLASHKSIAAAAKLATKPEFDPRGVSIDKGPPYAHQIGLVKLGSGSTVLTFKGPARAKPPTECLFTSYSDDVVALVTRLRT